MSEFNVSKPPRTTESRYEKPRTRLELIPVFMVLLHYVSCMSDLSTN